MLLYEVYELRRRGITGLNRALTLPTRGLQKLPAGVASALPVRMTRAALSVTEALQLTHERPDFGIDSLMGVDGPVTVTHGAVTSTEFGRLLRFVADDGSTRTKPKVLVVPGLAGHYATLVRGTISTLLRDHDVYVADWLNARDVPESAGPFGLDEYIEHLMTFLRTIGPGCHVVSVCQPAVACIAAAAVMSEGEDPAAPASLVLIAGPVDTRICPSRISAFAAKQSVGALERRMIHRVPRGFAGAGRRVYPGFLQISGFLAMDPRRHSRAFTGLFRDVARGDEEQADRTRRFYAEYFAVLDIAAEFYLETAQRVFIDHDLPRGTFTWRGRSVDPAVITAGLFTIEGANDDMCPPGQTRAAHDLLTCVPEGRRRHVVQEAVGHYGVFSGSTFESEIYPQIRDFIAGIPVAAG